MDLAALGRRVASLAQHDTERRIFGANAHRWNGLRLDPTALAAALARHGAEAPAAWAWWVTEGPGTGLGPFYGLQNPLDVAPGADELVGALPLSDQGCGYADWLITRGEHAGEVWIDLRVAEGPLERWYPSFEAWIEAWVRRSFAEWATRYLEGGVPDDLDPAFLDEVRAALDWATTASDDPMNQQYPLALDHVNAALATIHLGEGRFEAAGAALDAAANASAEPDARRALGRCKIASAQGDMAALLSSAEAGLASQPLWWSTEGELLVWRAEAMEGLERWDDGLAARIAVAAHYEGDAHRALDVAWIRVLRDELDEAAAVIRDLVARGVGCDEDAPEKERIGQVSDSFLDALRGAELGDRADRLKAMLAE